MGAKRLMPAFNFHPRFVKFIEDRSKTRTIRKKKRCKPGDPVYLFTNMRRKSCRKLGEGICTDVIKVTIMPKDVYGYAILDEKTDEIIETVTEGLDEFAKLLAFGSWGSCTKFYEDWHGLPFTGYMHCWDPVEEDSED